MLSEHSTCWCSQNRWRLVLERFQPFRRCWSRFYKCVAWVNCLQVSSGFYFGLQFCVKEDRPEKERKGQDMSEDVKHLRCAKLKGSYVAPSDEFTTERHCACHHLCTSLHLIAPGVECVALIFVSTWQAGVLPCGVCSWYLELLLEGTRLRVRADNFTHSTSMRIYIYSYFLWSL